MNHNPPPRPTGTSAIERLLAWLCDQVRQLRIIDSPDLMAMRSSQGTVLLIRKKGGTTTESVTAKLFKIAEVKLTYLSCHEVTSPGVVSTSFTSVAKPIELRYLVDSDWAEGTTTIWPASTGTDGQSRIVRYGQSGTKQFSEKIYPGYKVGDLIYAIEDDLNGIIDASGLPVGWIDLNLAGRHWECGFVELYVCNPVTQETKNVLVKGTEIY